MGPEDPCCFGVALLIWPLWFFIFIYFTIQAVLLKARYNPNLLHDLTKVSVVIYISSARARSIPAMNFTGIQQPVFALQLYTLLIQ